MTASITMGFESATDLVIPKYVKRNHDQKKFVIQRIGQEAFYNRTLIGSITIPNTIQLIEYNAFFSMDSKNVNGLTFNYETLIGLEYNTYIFDQGNFGTESPNPTVKNLNPKVSNEEMLAFLKTKRLPDK
jgi:hypothetical protein